MEGNVHQTDQSGWQSLHWAANGGHSQCCQLLLDYGARIDSVTNVKLHFNPCAAESFASIFSHSKLELLTQFPASNDEKYLYFGKIDISNIELLD